MNIYEDKYLREKVKHIIDRQKDGKIIVAAYQDGTCMPAKEDLGIELAWQRNHTIMRLEKPAS